MGNRDNLLQRNGIWYVRLAIPRHLQTSICKREIVRSLGTKSLPVANRIKHTVITEIRGLIADAERAYGKVRISTRPKHSDPSVDALLSDLKLMRRQQRMGLLSAEDLEIWQDILAERAHDLEGKIDKDTTEALSTSFYSVTDTSIATLGDAIEEYLAENKPPVITQQTLNAKKRRLQELQDFIGNDCNIRKVTRQLAGRYVAQDIQQRKLAVKTKKDILSDLSAFFSWAEVRGYVEANPFWRMSGSIKASTRGSDKNTSRRPWSADELSTFITKADPTNLCWSMFALALYTGMRVTELAEMKLQDVHKSHLHITAGKSKAAVRDIPIHPVIKPLVEHLKKTSGDTYLIAGLKRGGENEKRSHYFSKQFGTLKRRLGITDDAAVFHSLRGNFITALEEANVPLNQIELLVGHTRSALAYGTYSRDTSLEQLAKSVSKVTYSEVDKAIANRTNTMDG